MTKVKFFLLIVLFCYSSFNLSNSNLFRDLFNKPEGQVRLFSTETPKDDPVKTACKVLGLNDKATAEEAKLARWNLMKKIHPDVIGGSEDIAKRVNAAYVTLSAYLKAREDELKKIFENRAKPMIASSAEKSIYIFDKVIHWLSEEVEVTNKVTTNGSVKEGVFSSKEVQNFSKVVRRAPRGVLLSAIFGACYFIKYGLDTARICAESRSKVLLSKSDRIKIADDPSN